MERGYAVTQSNGRFGSGNRREASGDALMRIRIAKPRLSVLLIVVGVAALVALALVATGTYRHLGLPAPTGEYSVGKTYVTWTDSSRLEDLSPNPDDQRELPLQIWYPAEPSGERTAPYIPNLAKISAGLRQAGEVNRFEAWGLKHVRTHAVVDAPVAKAKPKYPVVIFSPGNSTNIEFYSSYAEELASQGYVVVGINHPYDAAAVELSDGTIAVVPPESAPDQARTARRVQVRSADILYVLDHLGDLNSTNGVLKERINPDRVSVAGHSLGGIAASQAAAADPRFKSCLNLDGLQGGGPFSVRPGEAIPSQPFLLITKDSTWTPARSETGGRRAQCLLYSHTGGRTSKLLRWAASGRNPESPHDRCPKNE